MSTFLVLAGFALLISTPNHPGAPDDPMLHPAVHVLVGAVCLLVGACLFARRIVMERSEW